MRLRVEYRDGRLEFDAPEGRLVAAFEAPADGPSGDVAARVRLALEEPTGYPPLRQAVVPGDRVVVPVDPGMPDIAAVLAAVVGVLRDAGVESIAAIVDGRERDRPGLECPDSVELIVHDPADRDSLAYLANTADGRRIYLNRRLADADIVVPIGRIGADDALGLRGPWSVVDPGLGDATTPVVSLLAPSRASSTASDGSLEVSWLLGSQFHVGGVPGRSGLLHVLCGEARAVRDRGSALVAGAWGLDVEDRADLVIAGIGGLGASTTSADLLDGLRQALRVVRRGGKVALLTRAGIGAIREAARGPGLPDGDWARALAWADVYLAGEADADDLDDLGLIPLDRPEQATRLAAVAPSIITISHADRARAAVGPGAAES